MSRPIEAPLDRRGIQRNFGSDRRVAPRSRCPLPVTIKTISEPIFTEICDCIDLSRTGIRLRTRNYIEKLTEVEIKFYIPDNTFSGFRSCQPLMARVVSSFAPNSEGYMQTGFCFSETVYEEHGVLKILKEYL